MLGVPRPEPSKADPSHNAYVFEHPVLFDDGLGQTTTKFIDLYKRGCLHPGGQAGERHGRAGRPYGPEAARSSGRKGRPSAARRVGTPPCSPPGARPSSTRRRSPSPTVGRRSSSSWTSATPSSCMPTSPGPGKTYVAFPDARTHRIALRDCRQGRDPRAAPAGLDRPRSPSTPADALPRSRARSPSSWPSWRSPSNGRGTAPEAVAHFLMRCLFTMFAEDVGLLPRESFTELLEGRRGNSTRSRRWLESLWTAMDRGDFSPILEMKLLRFNGELFADAEALPRHRCPARAADRGRRRRIGGTSSRPSSARCSSEPSTPSSGTSSAPTTRRGPTSSGSSCRRSSSRCARSGRRSRPRP